MKSLCNRRVSVWNPDTSKEIVRFVHEVHPVFAVTLSSFLHMLCGWNYHTMPTFNIFIVHLKCFSISGSYSSKYSVNAWKITNEVSKGWRVVMWLWMVQLNTDTLWTATKFKKWNPFVTDEFPYKPWYFERDCLFCTRSASRFCINPLYFLAHAMWVKWWYHANFQHFQSSFEMLFNFRVL